MKPKDDPSTGSGQAHQATDIKIIKYLAGKNLLFAKEKIVHSYPHCWRCDTPLLNYAAHSWFLKVTDIKEKIIKNNKKVGWVPEDIRDGRFGKWLEGARDWAISRSRFWGTPLPVWQNSDGSKRIVVDSLETLKKHVKKSGNKYFVMRHGEAESNIKHVQDLIGDPNNHLTEKGKKEAVDIDGSKFDVVIASSFLRTRETAEIITKDFTTDERLHEIGPDEDGYKVSQRMGEFIFDIEKRYQNKNILIISHGFPLWVLSKIINHEPLFQEEKIIPLNTGELIQLPFIPYPHNKDFELDLHRPYIDDIVLTKDKEEYRRVKEVFDAWYDSGSVPFASRALRELVPADFIAEGLDQTRGWFYTLIVLSTALFGKSSYKQVVVNGLVLGPDGKKLSKRLKNYPDVVEVLDKYGADALRYYLLSSPMVKAEDVVFSEKSIDEVVKKIISRLENVMSFYELYSNEEDGVKNSDKNILDHWINTRLAQLITQTTESLEKYELDKASRPINDFVDDLSTWYLRRSRTRPEALPKLRQILIELAKIMAPFMPFIAEDIYRRLVGGKESVHLEDWPKAGKVDKNILDKMRETREIVSLGLEARAKANIKVRQPLNELRIRSNELGEEFLGLIQDELNVKKVTVNKNLESEVELDTNLTSELIEEGRVRDAIRTIQEWRKEQGLKPGELAEYKTDDGFLLKHREEIEKATNIELSHIHN